MKENITKPRIARHIEILEKIQHKTLTQMKFCVYIMEKRKENNTINVIQELLKREIKFKELKKLFYPKTKTTQINRNKYNEISGLQLIQFIEKINKDSGNNLIKKTKNNTYRINPIDFIMIGQDEKKIWWYKGFIKTLENPQNKDLFLNQDKYVEILEYFETILADLFKLNNKSSTEELFEIFEYINKTIYSNTLPNGHEYYEY